MTGDFPPTYIVLGGPSTAANPELTTTSYVSTTTVKPAPLCKHCIYFEKAKVYWPLEWKADPKLHKCLRTVQYIPDLIEGKAPVRDKSSIKYCSIERDKRYEDLDTCGQIGKYYRKFF